MHYKYFLNKVKIAAISWAKYMSIRDNKVYKHLKQWFGFLSNDKQNDFLVLKGLEYAG